MIESRPDAIDKAVYTETCQLRQMYDASRKRLRLPPKELTPVTLMQRSVPER